MNFFSSFFSEDDSEIDTLSISAVNQPFYISIYISTLPTQHTTFIALTGKHLFDPFKMAVEVGRCTVLAMFAYIHTGSVNVT